MNNFFTPEAVHMQAIKSDKGVEIFRRILRALCERCGLQPNEYAIPFKINVRDGGIDAWVNAESSSDLSKSDGLINLGYNAYQIKTGTSFSASKPSDLRTLFFAEKNILHEGVKKCLDNKGSFIAFLFGDTNPDVDGIDPRIAIREELAKINEAYASANITIWKADQIAQLLSHFPNISLAIMNRAAPVCPIDQVKKNCGLDGEEYYETTDTRSAIDSLNEKINKKPGLTHIRYIGEPGIGKTRTIYEALSNSSHALESIYCESAEKIIDNNDFLQSVIEHAENHSIVLIVDECEPENRGILDRKFRNVNGPMTLISIHNEFSDADKRADIYLEPPKLDDEKISKILQSYGVAQAHAEQITQYCSGSPRVAHIVGQCLLDDPSLTELTKVNGIDDIWDIYIADRNATEDEKNKRKLILSHVALFRKFGWVGPALKKEAELIYDLIVKHVEPNLSYNDFQNVITRCINRKILQGGSTLYITPKLLHIKLWSDWCDTYSHRYDPNTLLESLNGSQLKNWFADMIRYVRESKHAGKYFQHLLAEDSIFQKLTDFQDGENGTLFIRLVQINPKAAVRAVSRALENCSHEELLKFTKGRRTLVNSLQKIALYGDCFEEAADLLLKLSLAENETWSNNATGVFKGLFSVIATGDIASTDLSPRERLPILLKYLDSSDKQIRLLAISAFDEALRASSITRTIIREREGLTGDPQGWLPKDNREILEEYDLYLKAFWEKYQINTYLEKNEIANVLLHHVRVLLQYKNFQSFVLDILRKLSDGDNELKGKVIEALVTSLRYDKAGLGENLSSELQSLHDQLSETDFSSMLRRYVGLNLLEDRYSIDSEDDIVIDRKLDHLAKQVVAQHSILDPELSWVLTAEAKNGFEFGKRLGLLDRDDQLWPKIISHWLALDTQASDFFLGGFLAGVFERDIASWEAKIHEITDSTLGTQLPYLVLRSGMSPNIAKLLLDKSRTGLFDPSLFSIYIYGAVILKIPEDTLLEIFEFMLQSENRRCISSAIEMIGSLLHNKHMLHIFDKEIFIQLITHEKLFSSSDESKFGSMASYTWNELALALAKTNKEKSLIVLDKCLQHLNEDNTIVGMRTEDAWGFLTYCAEQFPDDTWRIIAKNIDPFQSNGISIFQWLKGGIFFEHPSRRDGNIIKPKAFSYLPREDIFKWIEQDVETRAPLIARFAPFDLTKPQDKPKAFMRELIEKYGSSERVRNEVSANYYTEGWSGLTSTHLTKKIEKLKDYQEAETDKNVEKWLNAEISHLKERIEEAKNREEREEW